ncbi:MAG: hypothetical protein AB7T14_04050 [Candidatus Methylacidiphilaceae bacterium]
MTFRYRSDQIFEIVQAAKRFRNGYPKPFSGYGEKGRSLNDYLDLVEGPLINLRLHLRGGRVNDPQTYEAALILDDQRVRGIGYSPTRRKRRYKETIPAGWHENLIDPNLPSQDQACNRHLALSDFAAIDLKDFFESVCRRWNIQLSSEGELL